ncbi:hypothetical protein QBC32DRAFT_392665 [Pseudoneurospora amorphoporcata]|uniref:Uncharacterized protein n=1 Tax=Pseudoneurospora amorphoporcata TaxID=241081 RepID=A0AAN6P220_9PEZI|nr:hypothetical protein QBC32DRAFT_392665 [Pseudoneurospora amorphoporcata]
MVRRTACERIKITVGGGGGLAATSKPATKVFFLHRRLLCKYSEYFSTALSPRNRHVFIEADTGHFVFDDNDDDPDDFYRWVVWLYVCSGCKLFAVYEFQDDHRCRPSRLEESTESKSASESDVAGKGEGGYSSYGLPQPPPCMSLSDQIGFNCHHWHRRFNVLSDEEGEPDHIRHGEAECAVIRHKLHGNGESLSSTVTGWFCARDSGSGDGDDSGGASNSKAAANDPNAPLEAAAAYMFGYRILSREYRLFALAQFIQHVDLLTDGYKDELRNLLYEVFPVGSEAHRVLTAWVAWLKYKKRLTPDDQFEPPDERCGFTISLGPETAAFWKMFHKVETRKGSEAADPRRYPLFHWEQECSKGAQGDGTHCVHIEFLKWAGSLVDVLGFIDPNRIPLAARDTTPGQFATRPMTAKERWDTFFRLSKGAVTVLSYVLWWLAPVLILFFAADTLAQDKNHLLELYGKILGVVFAVQGPLAAWYRCLGWEWVIGSTMVLGIAKACGSFLWAKQCFGKARGDVALNTRPCKEEVGLGVSELLFVASLFWVLLNTKHDVHPSVANPEKISWGCRAARPGRESFVRRGLGAIWKQKDLLWWSCVALWHMSSTSMMVSEPVIWAKDHNGLVESKVIALLCAILGIVTAWYMAKWCRIVFLASTFLQLILTNVSGIPEVSPCFRRARDRGVDDGNGVCKLQAGLASAMMVHWVLSIVILLIWRNSEHPSRGIARGRQETEWKLDQWGDPRRLRVGTASPR